MVRVLPGEPPGLLAGLNICTAVNEGYSFILRPCYLLDFGDVSDEGFVVDVLEQSLQLVQVSDEVLTDPLGRETTTPPTCSQTATACTFPVAQFTGRKRAQL